MLLWSFMATVGRKLERFDYLAPFLWALSQNVLSKTLLNYLYIYQSKQLPLQPFLSKYDKLLCTSPFLLLSFLATRHCLRLSQFVNKATPLTLWISIRSFPVSKDSYLTVSVSVSVSLSLSPSLPSALSTLGDTRDTRERLSDALIWISNGAGISRALELFRPARPVTDTAREDSPDRRLESSQSTISQTGYSVAGRENDFNYGTVCSQIHLPLLSVPV